MYIDISYTFSGKYIKKNVFSMEQGQGNLRYIPPGDGQAMGIFMSVDIILLY